jgi:copper chaperone CopZ
LGWITKLWGTCEENRERIDEVKRQNSNKSGDTCCRRTNKLHEKNTGKPDLKKETGVNEFVSFPIRGMSCPSCVSKIEEALSGGPGVIEAVVNFQRREAGVHFDPAKVNPDELKGIVEKAGYRIPEKRTGYFEEEGDRSGTFSRLRPFLIGAAAALGVVGFYLGLLTLTSDWHNARSEFEEFGLWIITLAVGLGVQVTLFTLFRAWHGGGSMKGAKCSLATSGGMSTAAMAACCSHYLTLILPALGLPFLSSAAAGLASYQIYFFMAGILSNIFGIGFMLRLMIRSGMIRVEALENRMIFRSGH